MKLKICNKKHLPANRKAKREHTTHPMFLPTLSSATSSPLYPSQLASLKAPQASAARQGSVRAAWRLAWVFPICLAPLLASAQQAPLVTPRDLRPETATKPPAMLPQPAPATAPQDAETLFVRIGDISVKDGFAEFAVDTEALLSPVRNQRTSVAQLYKLAESIEMLYRDAGYALVRVLVPPQSLNDGDTLKLIVLDGFVERIDASAVDENSRSRVLTMMQGLVGQPRLRAEALERALTLAGRAPGLELRSTMGAGAAPGGVVLILEGAFTRASGSFSADNRLSDALGPWQTTLQATLNQPVGVDMQVYVNVSGGLRWDELFRGDAPRRVLGGGAIIPIGNNGLSINPELTTSVSQPLPPPGVPRSVSKFERYTLRLVYPMILNRLEELTITGTLDATKQIDTLPEFERVAADGSSLGAFILNQDRLRVARVGAAWSKSFDESRRISASTTLSSGTTRFGARTKQDVAASGIQMSRPDADPAFFKIEANVAYAQPLTLGVQSRSSLRMQKAIKGVLPSSELFSLDGEDALSTFVSGSISGDGGWMLRQEFLRPTTWQLSSASVNLVPYVFGAAGKTTSQFTVLDRGLSKAFGIGLRAQWRSVNVSMEYGRRQSAPSVLNDNQFFIKGQVQF